MGNDCKYYIGVGWVYLLAIVCKIFKSQHIECLVFMVTGLTAINL